MFRGIDVSHWQGDINWSAVKADGVEFVIIKAGGSDAGFYTDSKFEEYYQEAKSAGLNIGTYYFVGPNFVTEEDGIADAKRFIEIIKDKTFEYPVYIDLEASDPAKRTEVTDGVLAFCKTMEDAGYFVGIYASDISGFKDRVENDRLDKISKWVARYGSKPEYVKDYGMWQHSSTGEVLGIIGNVDMDYSYADFATIVKNAGLNGFSIEQTNENNTQPVLTQYTVGTDVKFRAIYKSSTDTEPVKPLYTTGVITAIREGAPNPYLINDGMGWVNDSVIEGLDYRIINPSISKGDKVKFVGTKDIDGRILHVYYDSYDVLELNDTTALLGVDGVIFARVDRSDIVKL